MLEEKQKRITSTDRREQIINIATESFSKLGYEKTTVASLATACGISEPALYRYFSSKEEMFAEVILALKKRIDTSILATEVEALEDIEEILFAISEHIFHVYMSNPELYRLLLFCSLNEHPLTSNIVATLRVPYITILKQALERLKKDNLIRPVNSSITACCFSGMVTECVLGIDLWRGMQGSDYEPSEIMKNNIPIFARGLKK